MKTDELEPSPAPDCSAAAGRSKGSEAVKKLWDDPVYRAKVSEGIKKRWADPVYRAKVSAGHARQLDDSANRDKYSAASKRRWADPVYRAKVSEGIKKRWADPSFYTNQVLRSSKWWVLRSPQGEYFQFSNLSRWCRENKWRFDPESYTGKRGIDVAYAAQIYCLKVSTATHAHGWTLVAFPQSEKAVFGSPQNSDYPEQNSR